MASDGHYHSNFPTVPASLSTGDHGMRDYYAEQEHTTQRPARHTLQDITPYLGLRSRLSQVWINRWTILLLLVLVRVLIAVGSLDNDLGNAKTQALSACSSVESMGSAMASMPYYMSQGTNEMAAKGVEKAVNGLQSMLIMSVSALEAIFVFVINMLYGTYECLITLAVGTAGHAAIAVAEDITEFLDKTISEVTGELSDASNDFEGAFNGFLDGFNNIFNGGSKPPQIDLSGPIDKLKDIKLPSDIQDKLKELDSKIPTYDEVHNKTESLLRMPFELVKKEMREHLGNFTFDRSLFPVPARKQLSFCSDDNGISSFFDNLKSIADTARKAFIAVLILAAILACIPVAWWEIKRWRTMQERAQLVEQKGLDPLDVIYIASRPHTAGAGIRVSSNFGSNKKQILSRWFVAYCTSTPALVVLSLALAGLFSCLCQYILLTAIKKEVPGLVNHVGAFADKVVAELNTASVEWANGTNAVIQTENKNINDRLFGWVDTSTVAVNDTLNDFLEESTGVLEKAFKGTVLEEPVLGVFKCLIGNKVEAVQKGLTWAKENAHVNFPLMSEDTFSDGASKALASGDPASGQANNSPLSDPGSSTTDKITEAVVKLTNKLIEGIRTEAIISTMVLCLYFFVCFCALIRCFWLMGRRSVGRAEGGPSYAGDVVLQDLSAQPTGNSATVSTQHTGIVGGETPAPEYTRGRESVNPFSNSARERSNEKDHWTENSYPAVHDEKRDNHF